MKRLSKAILITLAALVGVVLAALLGLNLYVQSAGTQARIQEALSEAFGMPLVITNTSLSPRSELRINGISVPTPQGNFLEATSFTARYRLLSLFQRRLDLYDLRADRPHVVWRENEDGKYLLPTLAKKKKDKRGKRDEDSSEDFHVHVEGFKILHGSIEFIDKERQQVAAFADVEIDFSTFSEERVAGTLAVGRLVWGKLPLEQVRTAFDYSNETLALTGLESTIAGGSLRGALTIRPEGKDAPFTAALQFEDVNLADLMKETDWAPDQFGGRLRGTFEAKGGLRTIASAEGIGTLELANGQIKHLDLFRTIGDVLRVPQLAHLRLQDSRAEFHLGDEKIHVDTLALNSSEVQVTAKGVIRYSGKLDLDTRLGFTERTAKQLPEFVRKTFTNTDPTGQIGLDFKIKGTLEKPKTDLIDRVIGNKLSAQFDDLVTSLFGGKKKKDDERKKEEKKKKQPDPSQDSAAPAEPAQP